ncbi:hypothetical protein [Kitasatospora griseola]|uniref:hypothetical protein n=1 Tax=Kitasatospora griseola TaxID=2064 RepID=UPI00382EA785
MAVPEVERVRLLALRYCAGELSTGELPMAAAELVADGFESSVLYDLAGRGRRESASEVEPLLREVLDEFGLAYPGPVDGRRWLLRELAARVLAGGMTPVEFAAAVSCWDSEGLDQDESALLGLLAVHCDCCAGYLTAQQFREWEADVRSAAASLPRRPGASRQGEGPRRQANWPGT